MNTPHSAARGRRIACTRLRPGRVHATRKSANGITNRGGANWTQASAPGTNHATAHPASRSRRNHRLARPAGMRSEYSLHADTDGKKQIGKPLLIAGLHGEDMIGSGDCVVEGPFLNR